MPLRFTIRDLLWLTLVVALVGAVRHAEGGILAIVAVSSN
jgi:hypothetical protein